EPLTSNSFSLSFDPSLKDSSRIAAGTTVRATLHTVANGAPFANLLVGWTVSAGHGTLSAVNAVTDTLGNASVSWKLGDTVGVNTLTAYAAGDSLKLNIIGIAGPPSAL